MSSHERTASGKRKRNAPSVRSWKRAASSKTSISQGWSLGSDFPRARAVRRTRSTEGKQASKQRKEGRESVSSSSSSFSFPSFLQPRSPSILLDLKHETSGRLTMVPIMRRVVSSHMLLDELFSGEDELSLSFNLDGTTEGRSREDERVWVLSNEL